MKTKINSKLFQKEISLKALSAVFGSRGGSHSTFVTVTNNGGGTQDESTSVYNDNGELISVKHTAL
ncbi:hypothetical protein [Psychroserpens algicola]|uniref:hypothetical protein n=1 Tax=Psychroserpens algicola TaxID=1719034 RepID=UPI0019544253|nr:hypothetical protein [Psychroserpens algicola]